MALLLTLAALVAPAPAQAATHYPPGCNSRACVARVKARELRRAYRRVWTSAPPSVRAHLRRIAKCESGTSGDLRAISRDGRYRGRYQFSFATWAWVGGRGDPAKATAGEQKARAVMLYMRPGGGPQHWPVCQHR